MGPQGPALGGPPGQVGVALLGRSGSGGSAAVSQFSCAEGALRLDIENVFQFHAA